MNRAKPFFSDEKQDRILEALGEGFGVEDIALLLGVKVGPVRSFVFGLPSELRAEIYRQDDAS